MTKRTKIIATIGPATENHEIIQQLLEKGVNVFRFNTKHNTLEWHKEKIELVRQIAKKTKVRCAVLIDLQGPDIRIGRVTPSTLDLIPMQTVYLEKNPTDHMSIQLKDNLLKAIPKGQEVIIDDGKIVLKTETKYKKGKIKAKVLDGDLLTENKGIFFPGLKLKVPSLTKRDKDFIKLADKVKAEYVALSFVRNTKDIEALRKIIGVNKESARIVSKIETLEAVRNIDSIIEASDALMVARGDLGVEMYLEAVPILQKRLVKKSLNKSKPVIVATQMLKSMIQSPTPTRAEISDVANAAFEGADCVMLSEETAIGSYPIKAVNYMSKTLKYNELESETIAATGNVEVNDMVKAIVVAADKLENLLTSSGNKPKLFIVLTESGRTAQLLSSARPELPIYAFTQREHSANLLSMNWGVQSFVTTFEESMTKSVNKVRTFLTRKGLAKRGDVAIVISGQNVGVQGQTDSIRVVKI